MKASLDGLRPASIETAHKAYRSSSPRRGLIDLSFVACTLFICSKTSLGQALTSRETVTRTICAPNQDNRYEINLVPRAPDFLVAKDGDGAADFDPDISPFIGSVDRVSRRRARTSSVSHELIGI